MVTTPQRTDPVEQPHADKKYSAKNTPR